MFTEIIVFLIMTYIREIIGFYLFDYPIILDYLNSNSVLKLHYNIIVVSDSS